MRDGLPLEFLAEQRECHKAAGGKKQEEKI